MFDKILKYARANYVPVMLDDTRALLEETIKTIEITNILEIGTAIGYSGGIMLTLCPNANLNTIEYNEDVAKLAKQNFKELGVADRANIFFGDAREIVPKLTGKYQFIFMDGPKGQYQAFLPYVVDLLDDGGVLMCDNVLYHGLVENQPARGHKYGTIARNMAGFLDDIKQYTCLETELYHIGDGVTISIKK